MRVTERIKQAGGSAQGQKVLAWCEKFLCPTLLFLLPFWNVNQGVDVMDTGYNLGNYANYDSLGNTWKLATYLANELAALFYRLPGGRSALGMNLYTTLLVSVMALAAWYFCKKLVPPVWAFAGEALAICLCWCPTVILYHYLTYFLMLFALIVLYRGIVLQKPGYYLTAGLLLGVNVFARFSNLTEIAFILPVWYGCYLKYGMNLKKAAQATAYCAVGFLSGYGILLAGVGAVFGLPAYFEMLGGIQSIGGSTSGYSVWDMLSGPWLEYAHSLWWIALLVLYALAGKVLFAIQKGKWETAKKLAFVLGLPFLYRYFWGRAVFDLNYYSYGAIFWPSVMLVVWGIFLCVLRVFEKGLTRAQRVQTAMVFLIIWLTPLGSNNKNYTLFNNLFLVLPFLLFWSVRLGRRLSFPLRTQLAVFLLFFAVQSAGFGALFVFGDGSYAQKRDTKIENNDILRGIYTTRDNARLLEELGGYYESLAERPAVLPYGNIPGLVYYLGAKPAGDSTWPDLPSYSVQEFEADLARLEESEALPLILVQEGILDGEDRGSAKYLLLQRFLEENGYRLQVQVNGVNAYYVN